MNQTIEEHFMNPRNIGIIENPHIKIDISNPVCGDTIKMVIRLGRDQRLLQVRYHAYGCSTSLAAASIISEFLKSKIFRDLKRVTRDDVARLLGELEPKEKHCIDLGFTLIARIIEAMQAREAGGQQ